MRFIIEQDNSDRHLLVTLFSVLKRKATTDSELNYASLRVYKFQYSLGRVFNSLDSPLNGLKMAKSCQTSSNSGLISRYYLRYFPCLTAIYLIFITIFEMKTCPNK